MNYRNLNDYELISCVRENDEDSFYKLFDKYQPIIKSIAKEYYSRFNGYGFDYDDFLQEGYIAFQSALKCYDSSKGALFYTFLELCLRRHFISFTRKISSSKKCINENNVISIDDLDIEDKEANISNISDSTIVSNTIKKVLYSVSLELSSPFELKLNNFTLREISILLDVPATTIGYRIDTVRKLIKNELNKNYIL